MVRMSDRMPNHDLLRFGHGLKILVRFGLCSQDGAANHALPKY